MLVGLAVLGLSFSAAAGAMQAQTTSLRPLADDAGVVLGAAVDSAGLDDAAYRALLIDHVNMLSTRDQLSMSAVQPEQGVFDFSRADAIVDFAAEQSMTVRGHELIGPDVPEWVRTGDWTAETLSQVLTEHITTVVRHYRNEYPGVVTQWDVVGDAVLPDGSLRPTIWQQVIGDDHVRIAFEAARAADPNAQLFYDDFFDDFAVTQDAVASGVALSPGASAERSSCDEVPKCVGVRDRVAALVANGVPIDGIGFQSHLSSPDPFDFEQFSSWVDDLSLRWAITEFDVPLPTTEIDDADSLAFQAAVYADALAACADAAACDTFMTWGITDRFSPIPFVTGGAFGGALWFDEADLPKPAFGAMADVLTERAPTTAVASTSTSVVTDASTSTAPSTTVIGADDGSNPDSTDDPNTTFLAILIGGGALTLVAGIVVLVRRGRAPR